MGTRRILRLEGHLGISRERPGRNWEDSQGAGTCCKIAGNHKGKCRWKVTRLENDVEILIVGVAWEKV